MVTMLKLTGPTSCQQPLQVDDQVPGDASSERQGHAGCQHSLRVDDQVHDDHQSQGVTENVSSTVMTGNK